jgi:DNA-binding transcriptional ArsR family regulator
MDEVFRALADPTRRSLLDELFREDGQTLSALEGRLPMTRFGVMKHLKQLEEAGQAARAREAPFSEPCSNPACPRPVGEQVRRTVGRSA